MSEKKNNFGIINLFEKNNDNCKLDIVFIHGLNGDPYKTWTNKENVMWSKWLFEKYDDIGVWSMGYDATSSAWKSDTMPMSQRGLNLLETLNTTDKIGTRPLIFIVHSMGGLILKYILELSEQNKKYRRITNNTKNIVFLATPHNGSMGATFLNGLNLIYRANYIVKELLKDSPELNRLETSFCSIVKEKKITCFTFYETKEVRLPEKKIWFTKKKIPFISTKGLKIVSEASARGSFNQDPPIPLDRDHIDICKLDSKNDLVFKKVEEYIKSILNENDIGDEGEEFKKISNSLSDKEEKNKSTNKIFLIFNADDISDKIFNIVGYIQDDDEYESDFLEFTFNDIYDEREQEKFLRLLHEKSQLVNIPVHFILPPELFLVNFKLWKYDGTELIKIYDIFFHNKNKFSMNKRAYSHMIDNWNTKFDTLKHKSIFESLLAINNTNDTFDCRNHRLGAYFNYQPEIHTNIDKIVKFTNIGIWNYSSGDIIDYKQWLTAVTLDNVNIESRNYDHVALLWDDMSLLKDLKDMRG